MPDSDVIIVGAGPAGCAAAVQCRRLGLSVMLLDRTGEPGGLTRQAWRIENYPGLDPMPGRRFAEHLRAFLERFELEVRREEVFSLARREEIGSGAGREEDRLVPGRLVPGREVVRLVRGHEVVSPGMGREGVWHVRGRGVSYTAACLVLATGTESRRPPIAGLGTPPPGIYFDVVSLIENSDAPGHVAILGGGEAACDHALLLAEAGWRVTLLLRGERLRARGRLAEWVAAHPAITPMRRTELRSVTGPPLTLDIRGRLRAPSGGRAQGQGRGEMRGEANPEPGGSARADDGLTPDALLIAAGRRSTAADLFEGGRAASQPGADHEHAEARQPETDHEQAAPPPAGTNRGSGLWIVGDARTGTLGQIGMAVGDGLAAAMDIAARWREGDHDG